MELLSSSYQSLPTNPGIYMFLDENGEVLYVGKAKNLNKRVSSYFVKKNHLETKTQILVSKIKRIKTINVDSEIESLLLEAKLIKKYNPYYNLKLTDGKIYPSIKITYKERVPIVMFVRKQTDPKAIYFGAFPNSGDLKLVLKLIRRVFPYQSVVNHPKKYCLYYHLKLCPCPPMFKTEEEFTNYKKTIKYLISFFEGNKEKIISDLKEQRDKFSKDERFEDAKIIQDKINAIDLITSESRNPFEYESNPNLRMDLRSKEINDLKEILNNNGVGVNDLNRIECYDISNISGTNAVGSMVVLTHGEIDTSSYRRFKIKNPPKVIPNDFAMMSEVISRRIKHDEWPRPDLIIVDGGKGQISSAHKTLIINNKSEIPLIGIAKREELLITTDFKIIRLPKNSNALTLVRRIRDEAHRFAITYHRLLRAKKFLSGN